MVRKMTVVFVIIVFLFTMLPGVGNAADTHPVVDGSFIQLWLVKDWNDSRWTQEFTAMKEAGMDYLVFAPTAYRNTAEDVTETIYPTSLEGFRAFKDNEGVPYPDMVDACLRNAQRVGIKVFLGLNAGDGWWENQSNEEWLAARMEEGNKVADELWSLYHEKYGDTICGWYWCWEADNLNLTLANQSAAIFARAISINIDHLKATGKRLPVMFCPFMNCLSSTPQEYADVWKYIFANSSLGAGDIFCPQDGIGAGGQTLDTVAQWFAALREAVNTKPGLQLWSDVETFVGTDWTGATIDRFVRQLELEQPYVDNYVTFAYCHYYSPYNTDPGFHNTYVNYVNTGEIEKIAPTAPANLTASLDATGNVRLNWDAATDNVGICGYYVYRDGRKISNKQVPRIDGSSGPILPITTLLDPILKPNTTYTYEIQAYDFAGNVSVKTSPIQVTTGEFQYLPNNISKGRLYKVTPVAHKNYPDSGRTELTDGIYANPSDIFDPAWQGWFSNPREVIVGLVEKRPIQQIVIGYLRDPGPSIYLPGGVIASVSDDGINYIKIGEFLIPNVPVEDPAARFSFCLTLDQPVEGKYVKIESKPAGGWTFVDEVEVRNNGDQYDNNEIVNDPNDPVLMYNDGNPGGTSEDLPNKISTGCSYTVMPPADANYPDTTGKELTDNVFGDASDPYDAAWQNWWHPESTPTEVIIDLGDNKSVEQVTADFLQLSSWGVLLPESLKAYYSIDGISYTELGDFQRPTGLADNRSYKLRLNLSSKVQTRYIKLVVDTRGHSVICDEVEARNSEQFLPNLISLGKPYTVSPGAIGSYPDTGMKELTDGIYGSSTDPGDSPWQGWYQGEQTAVIDLGYVTNVQQVCADFIKNSEWYIYLPGSVRMYASIDGVSYTEIGGPSIPTNAADMKSHKLTLTLASPVQARYVKVVADAGGALLFIDEIEVRNATEDAQCVSIDTENLGIGFSGGDAADSVMGSLNLPVSGTNGTVITWSSNNPDFISDNGTVKRPPFYLGDIKVTLTAEVSKGNARQSREFILTVKSREQVMDVAVNIDPCVLNLKAPENSVVKAYIKFTGGLKLEDIMADTLRINGILAPITDSKHKHEKELISDYDCDGTLEFMATFNRAELVKLLAKGENAVTLTGRAGEECFIWNGTVIVK